MNVEIALGIALAFSMPHGVSEAPPAQARILRVAVVIPEGADEAAQLCAQVGLRLSRLLRLDAHDEAVIASEMVDIPEASARLERLACDAVVVLGSTRPEALRRAGTTAYAASLGPDYGFRPAYLVGRKDVLSRERGLVAVFPQAMRTLKNSGE